MKRAILLIALFVLASCATGATRERYSGDLVWGFETSSFSTDDGRGPWWLSAEGDRQRQVVAPIPGGGGRGPWGRVHLVIEGQLSAPGHYGQLGAYDRELTVTRVISATLAEPNSTAARP